MAEKRFIKGLFKDTAHIDQIEGSWRYARNMVLNETDGAVSNEGGTELAGHLGNNPIVGAWKDSVIGKIEVNNDRVILFIKDVVSTVNPRSEIGIWENDQYTILYNPNTTVHPTIDLDFNLGNPIEGVYKIDSKGDLVIYWTDDRNPPRAFNVSRQLRTFESPISAPLSWLYNINPATTHSNHIDLLNLFPNSGPVPHTYLHDVYGILYPYQKSINTGGGLLTGVYYLALAYVDDDLVATNYLTVSNPVSIVDEYDHTKPTHKKDGAKHGSQTSKAIKWRVDNINTDYKYIQPVIIRKMGDATEAFKLNIAEIILDSTKTMEVVFSGLEGFSSASVEDVIIDTVSYDTVKTINQLDGVLYLGNLTGNKDLGYQKYANGITLKSYTKAFDNFDEYYATLDNLMTGFGNTEVDFFGTPPSIQRSRPEQSYRYIPNISEFRGYQRDEVYAFYIAFVLNDGSMSYAYHIPGRVASLVSKNIDTKSCLENNSLSDPSGNLTTVSIIYQDLERLSSAYSRNFHFFDFSSGITQMNYWENATEYYPDTEDFDIWDEFTFKNSSGTSIALLGSLRNDGFFNTSAVNVRHHHFPSNENKQRSSVADITGADGSSGLNCVTVPTVYIPTPKPWGGSLIAHQEYKEATNYPCNSVVNPPNCSFSLHPLFLGSAETGLTTNNWELFRLTKKYKGGANNYAPPTPMTVQDTENSQIFDACWSGSVFTADQPLTVTVNWSNLYVFGVYDGDKAGFKVEKEKATTGAISIVSIVPTVNATCIPGNNDCISGGAFCGAPSNGCNVVGGSGVGYFFKCGGSNFTITLKTGDKLRFYYQTKYYTGGATFPTYQKYSSQAVDNYYTHSVLIMTSVAAVGGPIPSEYLKDAKISHKVRVLGFNLEDVKIPKSIADKVQGFRIYYAKRGHSDKRILGQSIGLPMRPDKAKLGLCLEAWLYAKNEDSMRVMQTLQDTPVDILRKDSRPTWESFYPKYPYIYKGAGFTWDKHGYKAFSFPDFHLLRTKGSLAGATHIKPEYVVENMVWNGPTINRDKKEISTIKNDTSTSPPIKRIEMEWGWNTHLNCWGKKVMSALFIGKIYNRSQSTDVNGWSNTRTPFRVPKVIGQKAKSYIKGDSIFNAEALGFGGTIVNDRGDSSIVFSLKDRHEELCHSISSSSGTNAWNHYGGYHEATPFYLVGDPPGNQGVGMGNRVSTTDIFNLHSFKTDMYKSIDDQELVWTGFEVLGDDLNNFIFDDSSPSTQGTPLQFKYRNKSGSYNSNNLGNPILHTADYSTYTLQTNIQKDETGSVIPPDRRGIYGGDTFICRYGYAGAISAMDSAAYQHSKRTIQYHIVESPDNINFRHAESKDSIYFPGTSAKEVMSVIGPTDLNHQDHIKYNDNYSEVQDVRPAFPFPIRESKQDDFPTRTHRSVVTDTTSLIDNYRLFKANQFKDLPGNRGDLWKLATFNNLLYFHMEESLYAAKGKQSMQMKDGSEAFVGSGDIFAQEPDEMIQTGGGFGGTQSQWAALTTRYGYFFVDAKSRKIFLMKDKLLEISNIGMENWFKDNLKFGLEAYGFGNCAQDNPLLGMGLHSIWDPKHKRIILTKRDLEPTEFFLNGYNSTVISGTGNCQNYAQNLIRFFTTRCKFRQFAQGECPVGPCPCAWTDIEWTNEYYFTRVGWTISYYPELGVWGSFHDYVPYIYFNTSTDFYSLIDTYPRPVWCTGIMISGGIGGCTASIPLSSWEGTTYGNAGIWRHNSSPRGILYQENKHFVFYTAEWETRLIYYPFEFEFIHNETKSVDSLLSSFNYTLESFNSSDISILDHGFTNFFIYNTFQVSGVGLDILDFDGVPQTDISGNTFTADALQYLINIRRVGNNWKVNHFRDLSALATDTNAYYTQAGTNIIGGTNTGTVTTSSTNNMFLTRSMREIINGSYIDLSKSWNQKRKFIDKWVGIRLIYDNISNNLLNLYSTNVAIRKTYR